MDVKLITEIIDNLIEKIELQEAATLSSDIRPQASAKVDSEDEVDESEDEEDEKDVIEKLDSAPLYRIPAFAEICSFFNMFAHLIGLKPMSIAKLDKIFCTLVNGDVDTELTDLHVTLMRKIYLKSARVDKWEKSLEKFCTICPGMENEARQLQRHHYVDIPLPTKLSVLKALCDSQFECNVKFKENISNTFRNSELRLAPFGRDKCSLIYYLQIDCDFDVRIYTEEPEDEAGASWSLCAKNESELEELICALKRPEFGQKSAEEAANETADDDAEEEMDEEQILDSPTSSKKISVDNLAVNEKISVPPMKNTIDGVLSESTTEQQLLKMDEEQRKKIKMETKFAVLWDRFRKQELLNKRKTDREKQKKERAASKAVTTESVESGGNSSGGPTTNSVEKIECKEEIKEMECVGEEGREGESLPIEATNDDGDEKPENDVKKVEEVESTPATPDDAALAAELDAEDRRRILPRRSARNTAIQNLKVFTASPRVSATHDVPEVTPKAIAPPPKAKLTFVATAGSNSDDNSDEEESEEEADDDENENSSDDDFLLGDDDRPTIRRVGKPPTKRGVVKRKGGVAKRGGGAGRGGKSKRGGRVGARPNPPPTQRVPIVSRKKIIPTFAIDESSEDDEGELDDSSKEGAAKERKRATEKTLCQCCKSSGRPDLLLLCDSCDKAWHTFCLHPQLWYVPDGDWFCPPCEHSALVNRLTYVLLTLREEKKSREQQDKKKEAAADRLKREMDFIGISLNNIIPSAVKKEGEKQEDDSFDSTEESDEADGDGKYLQRASKKKAMKVVGARSRQQKKVEQQQQFLPIVTVAEGRSRRALNKVDYNFRSYDEQLQEAMFSIDPDAKLNEDGQSDSGAGRGKDMQNIFNAEKSDRKKEVKDEEDMEEEKSSKAPTRKRVATARPPKSQAKGHKNKRLTDLDIDNATESDSEEWHQSSADDIEEDPEPSEDEYLPSERRTSTRGRWARKRSDDEFINDDSDPDYVEGRGKRGGKAIGRKGAKGRAKVKRRKESSSTEEDENQVTQSGSESEEDAAAGTRRKPVKRKWDLGPATSSTDEDERPRKMTETGRPLRRAAAKVNTRLLQQVLDEEETESEEEEEQGEEEAKSDAEKNVDKAEQDKEAKKSTSDERQKKDVNPPTSTGTDAKSKRLSDQAANALPKKPTSRVSPKKKAPEIEDVDEFKPDEMDEVEADEEEEEEDEKLEKEVVDDDDDEEDEDSSDDGDSSKSSKSSNEAEQNGEDEEEDDEEEEGGKWLSKKKSGGAPQKIVKKASPIKKKPLAKTIQKRPTASAVTGRRGGGAVGRGRKPMAKTVVERKPVAFAPISPEKISTISVQKSALSPVTTMQKTATRLAKTPENAVKSPAKASEMGVKPPTKTSEPAVKLPAKTPETIVKLAAKTAETAVKPQAKTLVTTAKLPLKATETVLKSSPTRVTTTPTAGKNNAEFSQKIPSPKNSTPLSQARIREAPKAAPSTSNQQTTVKQQQQPQEPLSMRQQLRQKLVSNHSSQNEAQTATKSTPTTASTITTPTNSKQQPQQQQPQKPISMPRKVEIPQTVLDEALKARQQARNVLLPAGITLSSGLAASKSPPVIMQGIDPVTRIPQACSNAQTTLPSSSTTQKVIVVNERTNTETVRLIKMDQRKTSVTSANSKHSIATTTNPTSSTTSASVVQSPGITSAPSRTIFQPVNPQQLSQYFLRPSNTPPPPPSPKQQQQQTQQLPPKVTTTQQPTSKVSAAKNTTPQPPPPSPQTTSMSTAQPMVFSPPPPGRFVIPQQRHQVPMPSPSTIPLNAFPLTAPSTTVHMQNIGGPPPPPHLAIIPTLPPQMAVIHEMQHHPQFAMAPPPPQHAQHPTYFMHPQGVGLPPQIIYQTLQPYGASLPPHAFPGQHPQMQIPQSGISDQESLSHALAGAMNPEDL